MKEFLVKRTAGIYNILLHALSEKTYRCRQSSGDAT